MTSKEFIEKLKSDGIYYCKECNLKGCDNCEKERNAQFDSVIKDLEILQIIKEHLYIYEHYENDAYDDFAMYWGAGSSDSEWKKYNEEEYRKKRRVKEWWKEWYYYPNYKKGE